MPIGAMMNGMMNGMPVNGGAQSVPLTPQLNPMGSVGGNQNVPQLFGGAIPGSTIGTPAGFGGYNAGIANTGNMYGSPVFAGGTNNPYTNFNLSAMSPNQGLGQLPSDMGFLSDIASGQGAGAPVNQTPAWQSMVQAQNYNLQQGADSLAEQFNNGGGLFSTAYGNAQGQYQEQARLGQNAQLTQAQTQSIQQALQNQMGAAGQLSSQGYGALGLLSNQGFQAAQTMSNQGFQGQMANLQNQQFLQQLGLQGAGQLGNLGLQNLSIGNQLGNSQLLANQNQLTAAYQNWYNSQPQNNPLLSMMYAGATGYPQLQQSTYNPGMLGSLLGGLGGLAGGIGAMGGSAGLAGLLPLLGLSDRRLKENIKRVGKLGDASVYAYNFKGSPHRQLGFIAQELNKRHPEAVIRGDRNTPWMIDLNKLATTLGVR